MSSKRIEELMQNASAKDRELVQGQVEKLKGINHQVERETRAVPPPEAGSKPDRRPVSAPEPTHNETPQVQSQRGAEKIKQSLPSQQNAKSVDQGKTLDKAGATKEPSHER